MLWRLLPSVRQSVVNFSGFFSDKYIRSSLNFVYSKTMRWTCAYRLEFKLRVTTLYFDFSMFISG